MFKQIKLYTRFKQTFPPYETAYMQFCKHRFTTTVQAMKLLINARVQLTLSNNKMALRVNVHQLFTAAGFYFHLS